MPRLKNIRWEKFCLLLMGKHNGNRVQAYMEAYKKKPKTPKEYNTCRAVASEILANPNVSARLRELMDTSGITAEKLDTKLLYLIDQSEDDKVSLGAIKEGNALLKRTASNQPPTVTQISYEQHVHLHANGRREVGEPLQGNEAGLRQIQEHVPDDQHQVVGAGQVQAEPSAGDIRVENSGADQGGEAYSGFGT